MKPRSHRVSRLLPVALFVGAAGLLLAVGLRVVAGERAVAERTARERLASRAREGAGILVARAADLVRRAAAGEPDAIAGPDGSFLRPPSPWPFGALEPVPGRDPEGSFYLAAGERAETIDHDPERAAGLYRAAAAPEHDLPVRLLGLYRLAALARRAGDPDAAARSEAAFLEILPPADRRTLEAVIVRARARPIDDGLEADLLEAVGSGDEAVALGLLDDAVPGAADAVRSRRRDLALLARLSPLLAPAPPDRDEVRLRDGSLVVLHPAPDGNVRFATAPVPPLPEGVRLAGDAVPASGTLAETVVVGDPLPRVRLVAETPWADVHASARRSSTLLAAALAGLLLAGGAAFVLTRRAARREAAAARERAAFATRVGHDLRTPLALIRMYAETLAAGRVADPAQAREFAGIAAREAGRLTDLVGDVLDLSRAAEGNGALARKPLDLAALVREVAAAHRPLAEREGMRLDVRAERPLPVRGDAAALRGAVANLIENAVRHAAAGGVLEVSAREEAGEAVVAVEDRGPGIPPAIAASLFERFVRGPEAAAPGAGLGLALVQEVAAAHGGDATAADREGGGARMTVRLPLGEGDA